jgi:transcriptional repressor NrdR
VQLRELMVLKTSGERKAFDRDKVTRSMKVALRKRPVDEETLEMAINRIVKKLEGEGEGDIPSKRIGELVMEELRGLDGIAYVRYASVYRDFDEMRDFGIFVETESLGK